MEIRINYLALLLVIIIGVASGNILSNWFVERYSGNEQTRHISKDVEKKSKTVAEPTNELLEETESNKKTHERETIKLSPNDQTPSHLSQEPVNTEEQIEQRKINETGVRLAKQCSEWTVVHKDMQTKTSEAGMNKYCDQYYDYVSFGTLPEAK